ncbi:MFS transporter [Nocardioides sp. CFH 31398]|uniref:MFS transporter n=1 Tax=Nocardioides sp. CFH 31398 TaxID=2919579 RepID=UPI001F05D558|nr:MFS transporter [Nocardioides sp. CFH 31398]MCH1866247.1 MFS transporter [Nocardioides sp. CFH 31398]
MSAASTTPHTPLRPLLGAQLVFNTGFYAVVPFLAVVLRDDFALGGAAVGLVLGLRTFAQQGMFLAGGLLVDRLGARTLVVLGCAVRTVGFALLAVPGDLWLFVVGVVATGLGGALFSPALETLVAHADRARTGRSTAFALLSVVGETGAVLGPLLGAALLGWGFAAVAGTGALVFAVTGVVLAVVLRGVPQARRPARASTGSRRLPPAPLVLLAAVCSVNLLAYNQLYLGLPYELERVGLGTGALAGLFALASVLTVAGQLPLARLARRVGTPRAVRAGYVVMATGFLVLAVAAPLAAPGPAWLPVTVAVVLLTAGHLLVTPTTLEAVGRLAPAGALGASYGLMATAGGVAVLVGNTGLGLLYPAAAASGPGAGAVWTVLAVLPLLPALVAPRVLRTAPTSDHTPDPDPAPDPAPDHQETHR